ncbi:hypothetical protein FHG87_014285 [Trinorchestia longiramus]|nr:hypothetical protein FHG87_014285 [Trinorchestia longiramus]
MVRFGDMDLSYPSHFSRAAQSKTVKRMGSNFTRTDTCHLQCISPLLHLHPCNALYCCANSTRITLSTLPPAPLIHWHSCVAHSSAVVACEDRRCVTASGRQRQGGHATQDGDCAIAGLP